PRGGKIVQGPLWDFDRAFADSDDGRGFNPRRWRSADGDGGTDPFNPGGTFNNPWYSVMFTDPDFWQAWIDRYQELRKTTYSLTNLMAKIDFYGNQVREATSREYARWRGSGGSDTSPRSGTYSADGLTYTFPSPGTWQGEINFTKYWFSNRVAFIDGNFLNRPVFNTNGGAVPAGFALTISASTVEANSTIYYTLDGTDPRLPGGGLNPAAKSNLNSAVITLTNNARVFARNWNASHHNLTGANNPPISSSWSGPTVDTFVTQTPPLRITEIMYHPAPPPAGSTNATHDFEYIELQNVGARSLDLQGYQLSGGINFTFGNYVLGANQTVVLVRNLAAFQSRYWGAVTVAGVYTNNLSDGGEHLVLTGPLQEPVLDFSYNDSWYPATDGLGFSLVIRDPAGPTALWNSKEGWRPSGTPGGSPGTSEATPATIPPIVVTEALTHTDPPMVDTIELFNSTSNSVELGGWFLSDDRHRPAKYRIPEGTLIGPGGYLTFTTNQFGLGTNGFALSSLGDQVYLFSGDAQTNLTGYSHGFEFGAAPNGVSFGRYVTSEGKEEFVLQSVNTLGTNNAYPR
ncbi:MAG TPA: lamin tail domain-containing protein, partial [Verrucomicrobiae bacterium]|nr:lamin tail domain-containing protein [Verrucomicrobiae bacterium]